MDWLRLSKVAMAASLCMAACLAAAQDSFPDTPRNHWAYEAVSRLRQDGFLQGYADGYYLGARPTTRYEMAAEVFQAYMFAKSSADSLAAQVQEFSQVLQQGQGDLSTQDFENLKSSLAAAKEDLASMKGWGEDVGGLKKLVREFDAELIAMGVDIAAVQDELGKLDARITAVEKQRLPVDVGGDFSTVALGGYAGSNEFGITVDGRPTGVGRGSYAGGDLDSTAKVGATRDLTILQEAAIRMVADQEQGASWKATVVAGDMAGRSQSEGGSAFENQSQVFPGAPFGEGDASVYLQDLSIMFDSSLAGVSFNAEVGRVGYSISPYIFQRPDNTPYFDNGRWDDGLWNFDGAIVMLDYGATKFRVFGGRNDLGTGGVVNQAPLQPIRAGATGGPFTIGGDRPRGLATDLLPIDQSLGASLKIPLTQVGTLSLAYLWLSSNEKATVAGDQASGVRVYGGDLSIDADFLSIKGGYSKSDLTANDKIVQQTDNDAYWIQVGKQGGKLGADAGYRYIAPQFGAPGDWGRIGIWWNPTDIKGFKGDVSYAVNPALSVKAGGEFYTGAGRPTSTLTTDDKIQRLTLNVTYQPTSRYDLSLGFESTQWNLADRASQQFAGGSPIERWLNLGLGVHLSAAAQLKFLWQISNYDSDGVAGFGPFAGSSQTSAHGGLITTQLSVKF